jgi:hypothetical protein
MNDAWIIAIIGLVAGAVPTLLKIWWDGRKAPSKSAITVDLIADTAGQVLSIVKQELSEAKAAAKAAMSDAEAARAESYAVHLELLSVRNRMKKYEYALMELGIDPMTINGS